MRSIAILGAGFCGLALAYFLSCTRRDVAIYVFDPAPISERTSGLAAGLLHPYTGAQARLHRSGWEKMAAAKELLAVSSAALGRSVAEESGLLRAALTAQQVRDFQATSRVDPQVQWWSAQQCQEQVPGMALAPGLWIPGAIQVNCPLYLEGLEAACRDKGVQFIEEKMEGEKGCSSFDRVIGALGAATCSFPPFADLPIRLVKGQVLELEWPKGVAPLRFGLNAKVYLVMKRADLCVLGATFERAFSNPFPDQALAEKELLGKAIQLFPSLAKPRVLGCYAGLRAATPDHQPLVRHVKEKFWVMTGLGSKGLLYHAWLANRFILS